MRQLMSFRVTLSHVAFGMPAGFFLPVGILQDFDYFPLQSFNWYLASRKRCSNIIINSEFEFLNA